MLKEALVVIGIPAIRAVAGWLENSLEDGKLELFEWRQLALTEARLILPVAATFIGLNVSGLGFDVATAGSLAVGFIFDKIEKRWLKTK